MSGALSARGRRRGRALALLLTALGCAEMGSPEARSHYPRADPQPDDRPRAELLVAQLGRFGREPPPLDTLSEPRLLDEREVHQDQLLLVFSHKLDPVSLDPRAFAILRGDGRRVRPVAAVLAPADERDEHRSATLFGNFGTPDTPPVAVHIVGQLFTEDGLELHGLDAEIFPPERPDRPVAAERLSPDEGRCPGAAQVLRVYFSDALRGVAEADLAGIELRLADGSQRAPIGFDDQGQRDDQSCGDSLLPCPADDNVLDLCVDSESPVVHLHLAEGLFLDPEGHATAAADLELSAP